MNTRRRVAIALDLEYPFPHHHDVFAGTQRYASEHPQWECVIDEHPLHKQLSGIAPFQKYDGVIARATPDLMRRLKRVGVPLVNTWFQMARPGLPGVYVDYLQMGRLAAEHLLERGFRRFSFVATPEHKGYELSGKSFVQRVQEEGYECQVEVCPLGKYEDPVYWASLVKRLNQWLDNLSLPAALFVNPPLLARLWIGLCQNRGWHVPRDVAVLCEVDLRLMVEHPAPQISSIDLNYERVGYEAAALLDQLIEGEPTPSEPTLIPVKGVIARESTDYFAVEDEVVAEALQYISSHLRKQLTLERIAEGIAVSTRSLQRRFNAALGRSVSAEIRRLRLEKAKRMLGEPDRQISEIARLVGFGQPGRMSEAFQRELGLSPSDYRRKVLGERTT